MRAALSVFNFLVFFVVVNLLVLVVLRFLPEARPQAAPPPPPPPPATPGTPFTPHDESIGEPKKSKVRHWESLQWVDLKALEGLPPAEVEQMLDDHGPFCRQGYEFQPFVQFAPLSYRSATVNVEGEGEFVYRRSVATAQAGQGEPLDVYVLGGSTMFGMYVADGWTLPSYLWDELQKAHPQRTVRVTNFGRPYYYSSQEVALLARLLKSGRKPHVVVFVDGLNDCFIASWQQRADVPMFTSQMTEWIRISQYGKEWLTQYRWIPLVKLAFYIRQRMQPPPAPPVPVESHADTILNAYRENVRQARALCREYGVTPYFVWQPVPFVRYDMANNHRRGFFIGGAMQRDFEETYARIDKAVPGVINLSDAASGFGPTRKAYVDNFHYNPAFNRYLAGEIARAITVP